MIFVFIKRKTVYVNERCTIQGATMKFSIPREALLAPIAQVVNVVERRQTLPVLANFLIEAVDEGLSHYRN